MKPVIKYQLIYLFVFFILIFSGCNSEYDPFENNDDLKNYTLTGSFDHQEIDTLLAMICTALDIDFEKQNNGYILRSKK